ncbi:MAG: FCD domain-containing protein [Pseudomonadota bacterium]
MPFQKITPERVSDAITRQIEALILRGVLRPGERLPSERDLATKLGASRPSVREALAELEQRGLLVTRAGSGAFVADVLGSAFSTPLIELFSTHDEALFDYLTFRRDLEGLAAERAARYGTPTDLQVITTVFEKMEAAHSKRNPETEAGLDAEFHMAIVEAAHNIVMLHTMRSMFDLLKRGVFYNRQLLFGVRDTRSLLLSHHRRIHDAILARNPREAREAVEEHLSYIETAMREHRRVDAQEEVAKLRFEHARDSL